LISTEIQEAKKILTLEEGFERRVLKLRREEDKNARAKGGSTRLRNLEKRTHTLRARLTPQMICEARDHYFRTGELPADHPELEEMVVKLVEAVWAMKATVPGPPREEEAWGLVTDSTLRNEEFDAALEDYVAEHPSAMSFVGDFLGKHPKCELAWLGTVDFTDGGSNRS
jgi:hypothetical protein